MINWFKARLNRDNFCNIMFWLGMTLSAGVVDILVNFLPILAVISFILTFSLVPYLLTRANKVTYTEDKIFLNKQGESLASRYPKMFGLVFILNVPVSIQLFFSVNKSLGGDFFSAYIAIILFLPTLYFIIKNCPISLLFNKNAWCKAVTGITPMSKAELSQRRTSSTSFDRPVSAFDKITKPQYCYLPQNNYYKR